jgi:hypothetical protein
MKKSKENKSDLLMLSIKSNSTFLAEISVISAFYFSSMENITAYLFLLLAKSLNQRSMLEEQA